MPIKLLPRRQTPLQVTSTDKGLWFKEENWAHREEIGEGTYGVVYRVDFPTHPSIALKHIFRHEYIAKVDIAKKEITLRCEENLNPRALEVFENNLKLTYTLLRIHAPDSQTLVVSMHNNWFVHSHYQFSHPKFENTLHVHVTGTPYTDTMFREITILEELTNQQPYHQILRLSPCFMVHATVVYAAEFAAGIVMDLMDGSLDELEYTMSIRDVLDVCHQLTSMATCLLSYGYYYTDLKFKNILYRQEAETTYITLGDYGSLTKANEHSLAMYPHPHYYAPQQSSEDDVVWGIFMVFIKGILKHYQVNNVSSLMAPFRYQAFQNVQNYQVFRAYYVKHFIILMKEVQKKMPIKLYILVKDMFDGLWYGKIRTLKAMADALNTLDINTYIWNNI